MPTCKLSDCPVAQTGRCLEGKGQSCPNLIASQDAPVSVSPPEGFAPSSKDRTYRGISPYSGNPLSAAEAANIVVGRCAVVTLIGAIECGKTSLLGRIHHLFMTGPIDGISFVGSRTLLRLEELNWKATVISGAQRPEFDRTSRIYDNHFLHFRVNDTRDGRRTDLFVNDLSGDTFADGVRSDSICAELVGPQRADHLAVVVDGEALVDLDIAFHHQSNLIAFVQRLVQLKHVGRETCVHVIFSKRDIFTSGPEDLAGMKTRIEGFEKTFNARFSSHLGKVTFWRIAARPMDGSDPTAKDISKMFGDWVRTTLRQTAFASGTNPADTLWKRDYCRFGLQHTPSK